MFGLEDILACLSYSWEWGEVNNQDINSFSSGEDGSLLEPYSRVGSSILASIKNWVGQQEELVAYTARELCQSFSKLIQSSV